MEISPGPFFPKRGDAFLRKRILVFKERGVPPFGKGTRRDLP
jgi:hypothetical protein